MKSTKKKEFKISHIVRDFLYITHVILCEIKDTIMKII